MENQAVSHTVASGTEQDNNPFKRNMMPASVNAGSVAIEQERAVAEAQGQLILAKKFPRELNGAHAELMAACKSKAFADVAFYSVPNRGSGPSIRFAEEVARVYGNFQYGHRELSRDDNKSEVEVYAWDMEKNNRSIRQITVKHVLDTKNGPKPLRDQADIDNKIANVASKQVRGRIMALMPKWLVEDAIQECRKTIAGNNEEPIESRVRKMTQAFARWGLTPKDIEKYLGHSLDQTVADEIVELTGVFNALKEGAPVRDYFPADEGEASEDQQAASLKQTATGARSTSATQQTKASAKQETAKPDQAKAKAKVEPKQEKKPEPEPEPESKQQAEAEPEPDQEAEPEKSTHVQKESTQVEESAPQTQQNAQDVTAGGEEDPQQDDVF